MSTSPMATGLGRHWPWIAVLAFVVLPWITDDRYLLAMIILFFVWSLVVVQWNLVLGQAGIFSLVQFAIFNLGAYFTAIVGTHLQIAPALSLIPAGLFCALFGLLVGLPCLRLRGPYVALLTLATHSVVYLMIFADTSGFTGGGYGLYGFGDYGFRDMFGSFGQLVAHYYMALILLIIACLVAIWVMRSPLGLAFRALRDSEGYAGAIGISRYRYQLIVFTLTSFFIGVAGSFYGTYLGLVDATGFDFGTLMLLLAMIVVGGMGTRWGPILGCALLMVLSEFMRDYPQWRTMAVGGTVIVFLLLWPRGIADAIARLFGRATKKPASSAEANSAG
ncbi:MAG: branched-chain amino acid ABC transporter permease [Dongiaceae bacterium]